MLFELKGEVRAFLRNVQKGLTTIRMTMNESLAVAQVEGEGDESTRAGIRYGFGWISGVTGQAPVQAIGSTNAPWLLWNPQTNPATIFIDELGFDMVSGTGGAVPPVFMAGRKVYSSSAGGLSICTSANIPTTSTVDMVTTNEGVQAASLSQLIIASNITVGAGSPFEPVIESTQPVASPTILTVSATNRDIKGKIALAPGTGYALTIYGAAGTTPLYCPHGTYREYISQMQ